MPVAVRGIDFTSRPGRRKPIACLRARLTGTVLQAEALDLWPDFAGFEAALAAPADGPDGGPWIAGLDFPFGQSRRFVTNIGWPQHWAAYVAHVGRMDRAAFRDLLTAYRTPRAAGDKEHRRAMDAATGAISPQKLYGVPVALMFFEGAPRLLAAGVTIPGLREPEAGGDPARICVEAYPGVLARTLIGRRSYKTETRARRTPALAAARADILAAVQGEALSAAYGLTVSLPPDLAAAMQADHGGDSLDALLCAIQAAWSWLRRDMGWGMPPGFDALEGWIADPACGG